MQQVGGTVYPPAPGFERLDVAPRAELKGLPKGEHGIVVNELGPYKNTAGRNEGKWEWTFAPMLTKSCDLCAERTEAGKLPMCREWL